MLKRKKDQKTGLDRAVDRRGRRRENPGRKKRPFSQQRHCFKEGKGREVGASSLDFERKDKLGGFVPTNGEKNRGKIPRGRT